MFTHYLKEIRKERLNLSQQEMAEKLHLSQSAYSRYESGNQDIPSNILIKMKEKFDVDPQELIPLPHQHINCEAGSNNVNIAINSGVIYAIPKELPDKLIALVENGMAKKSD